MKTDMSPRAITLRLKQTSELRTLCIALGGERLKKRLKKDLELHKPHKSRYGTPE